MKDLLKKGEFDVAFKNKPFSHQNELAL